MKLMRRIRRNVDCIAGAHDRFRSTEGSFQLTFEQDKGLFEIVAMGRRPAAGRNMHIDETKAFGCIIAGHKQGVGISHDADVREAPIFVRLGKRQNPGEIVERNR